MVGGSHGGFLGGHLVGQSAVLEAFGVDFKCAVLRNPVTDVGAMVASTDIPDWCFVETLGIESYTDDPSLETLAHMRSKSPIAHVANVAEKKRPVMMLIGAADRRVPPTSSLRYAAALRAARRDVPRARVPRGRARARQATDGVRVLRVHRDVLKGDARVKRTR